MHYTIHNTVTLRLLGQAYGSDAYGENTYSCTQAQTNCDPTTNTTTNTGGTGILAPVTGFLRDQPATIVIPVLLVVAVLLAALGLLAGKLVTKLRHRA